MGNAFGAKSNEPLQLREATDATLFFMTMASSVRTLSAIHSDISPYRKRQSLAALQTYFAKPSAGRIAHRQPIVTIVPITSTIIPALIISFPLTRPEL